MGDGFLDPEQLARGYRHYKALEHQRRGYAVVRELVRNFLAARRWELRQPEQLERASLELVDALLLIGAVALYQCGVNDENWRDHEQRKEERRVRELEEKVRAAANDARDDERRRVDQRLQELDGERQAERYEAELRSQLERAELESAEERKDGVVRLDPRRRG